jgi:hypothetical protein
LCAGLETARAVSSRAKIPEGGLAAAALWVITLA